MTNSVQQFQHDVPTPSVAPSNRVHQFVVGLLVVMCGGLEFYPFNLLGMGETERLLGGALSSTISPLLMVFSLSVIYRNDARGTLSGLMQNVGFLWATFLVSFCIVVSALINQLPDYRVLFGAVNFLVGSVFILMLVWAARLPSVCFRYMVVFLVAWIVIPLMLAPFELQDNFFLTCTPFADFHGFSNGRLLFGFWSGFLVIILAAFYDSHLAIRIAFSASYCALVACQTRGAIGLATLAVFCLMFLSRKNIMQKAYEVVVSFAVGFVLHVHFAATCQEMPVLRYFFSDQIFNALNIKDPTRLQIYSLFMPASAQEWLWGAGKVKLITIAAVGDGIQAHNIFLQALANFGVFTLLFLLIWCWLLSRLLKTLPAKILFGYFLGFSMLQPLFGSSLNFFAPRTLLALMFIAYFDHTLFNRTRRS